MNSAYLSSLSFTSSSTRIGWLLTWVVWVVLSEVASTLLLSAYKLSDSVSDKLSGPSHTRGQNTSCDFQQQEAGVTPEARRDRAAILRHGGVTPASDGVLAAFRLLALSAASAFSFSLLSPRRGGAGGEISRESCFLRTFHGQVQGLA